MNKTTPKKSKKAKWLSEEAFQIAEVSQFLGRLIRRPGSEEWREVQNKGERERYIQLKVEFQRIARRDKKSFFNEWCLITEKKKGERLEISSGKLDMSREHSAQRWAQERIKMVET